MLDSDTTVAGAVDAPDAAAPLPIAAPAADPAADPGAPVARPPLPVIEGLDIARIVALRDDILVKTKQLDALKRELAEVIAAGRIFPTHPVNDCLRCGYNWRSAKAARPKQCPRCNSLAWDKTDVQWGARQPGDPPPPLGWYKRRMTLLGRYRKPARKPNEWPKKKWRPAAQPAAALSATISATIPEPLLAPPLDPPVALTPPPTLASPVRPPRPAAPAAPAAHPPFRPAPPAEPQPESYAALSPVDEAASHMAQAQSLPESVDE